MARVLGAARLSHYTDESTSLPRQREQLELTVRARGDHLVDVTEDSDVSGAVAPFEREKLGPWLTDPVLISQWDVLMVAKLDRLTRSIADFATLIKWCKAHGKAIVSVAESLDFSTAAGRMFANLLCMFAEFERERMSERRAEAAVKLARDGKLNGGDRAVAYGYRRGAEGRPVVVQAEAAVLKRVAGWITAGDTLTAVCGRLSAAGTPTRRGGTWNVTGVSKMLTRLAEPYARADDGTPYYLPEILTADELAAVKAKLEARSFRKAPKVDGSRHDGTLLLHVAHCAEGHPLYSFQTGGHAYYRCHTCKGKLVRQEVLDVLAGAFMDEALGTLHYMQPVLIPASSHEKELADVVRTMEDVEAQVAARTLPPASAGRILAKLEDRRTELAALPVREAKVELRRTGRTVTQQWAAEDKAGRRRMLTELAARLTVRHVDGRLRVEASSPAMVLDWTYEAAA